METSSHQPPSAVSAADLTLLAESSSAQRQRARILVEMVRLVGVKGYADTSVADVVKGARVSRRTFYALFDSKEACFLEAYRHHVEQLFERMRSALDEGEGSRSPQDWQRTATRAYLQALVAHPDAARFFFVDWGSTSSAAQQAFRLTWQRFTDRLLARFESTIASNPKLAVPPDGALFAVYAGVHALVSATIENKSIEALLELEDAICHLCLAVLIRGDIVKDMHNPQS